MSSYSAICIGKTSLLTAEGAGTSGTYTWTNGLGNSPIVSVAPIDNQTYTVTGTDANGCRSSGSCLLIVSKCLGINSIEANRTSLLIYPNPNNGEFIISSNEPITLTVINELGQQVKEISITEIISEVKITGLAKGIYCITGKNNNGYVSQKIIVAD
jgi:type IX secretion system substrate protein